MTSDGCQVCEVRPSEHTLWIHFPPRCSWLERALGRAHSHRTARRLIAHLHECSRHTHVHLCDPCWDDYCGRRGPIAAAVDGHGIVTGPLPEDVLSRHG